jgi:hypothetical protein
MDLRPLIQLICTTAGIELPNNFTIQQRLPSIAVPSSSGTARKRIADLVVNVHDECDRVVAVLVLEVQLSWDPRKRRVWGLLAVAFAAEDDSDSQVVVFTPNPALRQRIREQLLPRIVPPPLLIEPNQTPQIFDPHANRAVPRCRHTRAMVHEHGRGRRRMPR